MSPFLPKDVYKRQKLVLFGHRLLFIYFCKELFQAMVKNSVHIKNIGELLSLPYLANDIRTRINSLVLDCNLVERQLSAPVFLNAATIILVCLLYTSRES